MLTPIRAAAKQPLTRRWLMTATGLAIGRCWPAPPWLRTPIKVGILHSLSGTMAISETTLKDVMLMLIEEQNKKGGVLGKKLEAVVVDPASNWPLFAEKARELISKEKVSVCSAAGPRCRASPCCRCSRSSTSILFYPFQLRRRRE